MSLMEDTPTAVPRIFTPEYYARMRDLEIDGWWNAAMRDAAAMLLAQVPLPRAGTLLDAGCGSGQTMSWFRAGYPNWQTIGIDIAREGLTAARALGEGNLAGASTLSLPFPRACVDAVISFDVLQHLPLAGGDRRCLAEFRRVLRPGGVLLVRTNAQSIPRVADDPIAWFHKYELPEIREKLKGAGFRIVRAGRVNALLGLAEWRRELRAKRSESGSYVGLLASPSPRTLGWRLKRTWLRLESAAVARGLSWPLGRTILALAVAGNAEASRDMGSMT